jgi:hypothetical protein
LGKHEKDEYDWWLDLLIWKMRYLEQAFLIDREGAEQGMTAISLEAKKLLDKVVPSFTRMGDAIKVFELCVAYSETHSFGEFSTGISASELLDVYKAINLQGHWYSCPNGHVYVIGECGGAMQVSSCPECGVRIGGTHHNLEATNRPATDFEVQMRELALH